MLSGPLRILALAAAGQPFSFLTLLDLSTGAYAKAGQSMAKVGPFWACVLPGLCCDWTLLLGPMKKVDVDSSAYWFG